MQLKQNFHFFKWKIEFFETENRLFETENIFVLVATHYQQKFDSPFELVVHLPQC